MAFNDGMLNLELGIQVQAQKKGLAKLKQTVGSKERETAWLGAEAR